MPGGVTGPDTTGFDFDAVAAVNVSTHAGRTDIDQIHDVFVPPLLDAAADITEALARR